MLCLMYLYLKKERLTLSGRRPLSYDNGLRHERIKVFLTGLFSLSHFL